jgi:hypothetical protein
MTIPLQKVEFPDEAKKTELAALICTCESVAHYVIGFMDVLSLHCEYNSDTTEQC